MRRSATVFLIVMLLLYAYAFLMAGRSSYLTRFDSVLVQDTAQIARNTVRGELLQTKYITPVGYTSLKRFEGHPDYIRYPLPVIVYSMLFLILPDSPVTIKILNALLFLLSVYLLARIFTAMHPGNSDRKRAITVSWAAAAVTSVLFLPYLRLALSDAYEMITVAVFLLVILELSTRKRPAVTGILYSLLCLSRTNMAVVGVFVVLFILLDPESTSSRLKRFGLFTAGALAVLLPFILRTFYFTGRPLFSIQQTVELASRDIKSHNLLYRSFKAPPSLMSYLGQLPVWFFKKYISNLHMGFSFLLHPALWPAVPGLALLFIRFRKARRLVLLLSGFLLVHLFIVSAYVQLFRIYIPIFLPLVSMGYLGLLSFASGWIRLKDVRFSVAIVVFTAVMCAGVITIGRSGIIPNTHNPVLMPSPQAREALRRHVITGTYSNSPFWIPWHADIIAVYAPIDLTTIETNGPPECRHFMETDDPVRRLSPADREYLDKHGSVIEKGARFTLYRLNPP